MSEEKKKPKSAEELAKENAELKKRIEAIEAEELKKLEAEEEAKKAEAKAEKEAEELAKKSAYQTKYDEYTQLYFMKANGAKFPQATLDKIKNLESEVKKQKGTASKVTKRAALGQETILLIEGITIPDQYLKFIKDLDSEKQAHYI